MENAFENLCLVSETKSAPLTVAPRVHIPVHHGGDVEVTCADKLEPS
jgi:hypothetical protein